MKKNWRISQDVEIERTRKEMEILLSKPVTGDVGIVYKEEVERRMPKRAKKRMRLDQVEAIPAKYEMSMGQRMAEDAFRRRGPGMKKGGRVKPD